MNKKYVKQVFHFTALSLFFSGLFFMFIGIGSVAVQLYNQPEKISRLVGSFKTLDKDSLPKLFVIQSGSMEPSIETASLILSVPRENYTKGEVISFNSKGRVVTHRIARVDVKNGTPMYFTKGDANEDLDAGLVYSEDIVGSVMLVVPKVGYAVDQAKTPKGFILLVIIPATIIIYEELRKILSELRKMFRHFIAKYKKHPITDSPSRKTLPKTAIIVPIFASLIILIGFTGSYFFDLAEVKNNFIGVHTPIPTQTPSVSTLPTLSPSPTSSTRPSTSPTSSSTPRPSISPTPTNTPRPTESSEPSPEVTPTTTP